MEGQNVVSTGPEAESKDTTSDGLSLSVQEHVEQTELELSGEAYKYTEGNGITITTEDKEAMLRALNNIIRLTNAVLRDRQHAISKLEVDLDVQVQRGPRQLRTTTSDSDSQPDAKRSRSSSSSPRSPTRAGGRTRRVTEDEGVPDPSVPARRIRDGLFGCFNGAFVARGMF